MESTQGMVLQSCMSMWRMPGKHHLWPHAKRNLPWLSSWNRVVRVSNHDEGTIRASNYVKPLTCSALEIETKSRNNALRLSFGSSLYPFFPVWYYQTFPTRKEDLNGRLAGKEVDLPCVWELSGMAMYWGKVLTEGILNPRGTTTSSGTPETLQHWRNGKEMSRGVRTEAWLGRHYEEGDWQYSPEWWGTQGGGWGRNAGETVFESQSAMHNGVITVTAHPASTPRSEDWTAAERDLQQRQSELGRAPRSSCSQGQLKVLGYEWRVLRFNSRTRQSVAKVLAVSHDRNNPASEVFLVQQPNCIAFEYVKSMLSVGLTTMSLAGFSLEQVAHRARDMRILCIGLGGGSLPLFLAHNLPGATLDVVEIDGAVIEAAVETMGFPPCNIRRLQSHNHGMGGHVHSNRDTGTDAEPGKEHEVIREVLWESLNRMTVYEADGEAFVEDLAWRELSKRQYYDLVFVDAFDGEDVVPTKLWTRNGPFLTSLNQLLHPKHGTVVVNLHTDAPPPSILERATGQYGPGFDPSSPQGRKIQEACWTYRDALISPATTTGSSSSSRGIAFTVAVPSQGNISLVVSRGISVHRHLDSSSSHNQQQQQQQQTREKQVFLEKLKAESKYVQKVLTSQLDFSKRVSRGFQVVQEKVRPAKVR